MRTKTPYWLKARFNSVCVCGKQIKKGDNILYYPAQKQAVCDGDKCGSQYERDQAAADFDEAAYKGGY